MRILFFRFLLVCVGLHVCTGFSQATTVAIVLSEQSSGYQNVARAIGVELERSGVAAGEITQFTPQEWTADRANAAHKVVIPLGAEALKQVLGNEPAAPVVAALLPRIGFERIVRDSGRRLPNQITAVFLDQPLGRRVDLIRLVMPEAKSVGVLWGPESSASQSGLSQTLQSRGLSLVSSVVANAGGLFGGLRSVLDEADILLAVPDPQVYSGNTIANILLTTYRARIPVMAFSPAYVKAGAMVAIYATPQQMGLQAAGLARLALQGSPLPAAQYPNEFEISVNDHVARSLGLNLDVRALTDKLLAGAKRL